MLPLKASKFNRYQEYDTLTLAKELLGKILVSVQDGTVTAGRIIETEAYLHNDPACHAFMNKKTKRNAAMFMSAGNSYVYLIYGMHYCFNVVSGQEGVGEAVLIRALEPLYGIEIMQKRRNTTKIEQLCSGPSKLCQAMGIDMSHNMLSLCSDKLYILDAEVQNRNIISTTRIGITKGTELPYRFLLY
ncbi:MAG: DNA-3-methyladenine glycosylase [Bacteroidia bacterium]|nr:DNA-3-methyladenine glycosylase [Bacteroidia bacterium]MDW8301175.1 DNA-3-methyladenine glycosylase [Bacteroidia bacterium]